VSGVKCREHPRELGPAEPAVGLIELEIQVVVEIDEAVLEDGQEGENRQNRDSGGDDEGPQPFDGFCGVQRGRAAASGRRAAPAAADVPRT